MMDDDWQHNGHRRFVRYSTIEWKRDNNSYRVPAFDAFCKIEKKRIFSRIHILHSRLLCAQSIQIVLYRFQLREAIQFKFVFAFIETHFFGDATRKCKVMKVERKKYAATKDSILWAAISLVLRFLAYKLIQPFAKTATFVRLLLACATFLFTIRLILFVLGDPLFMYHVPCVLQWISLLSLRRTEPHDCGAAICIRDWRLEWNFCFSYMPCCSPSNLFDRIKFICQTENIMISMPTSKASTNRQCLVGHIARLHQLTAIYAYGVHSLTLTHSLGEYGLNWQKERRNVNSRMIYGNNLRQCGFIYQRQCRCLCECECAREDSWRKRNFWFNLQLIPSRCPLSAFFDFRAHDNAVVDDDAVPCFPFGLFFLYHYFVWIEASHCSNRVAKIKKSIVDILPSAKCSRFQMHQ